MELTELERLRECEIKVLDLEEMVQELTEESGVLKGQLARVLALGDTKIEKIVKRLLEDNPNCLSDIEFDDSFNEAAEK